MAEQQQHTPSISHIRWVYRNFYGTPESAEFDRWYQAEIAAAEQRGAARGWDEGYEASDHEAYYFSTHGNTENPYRADQIQGDTDDQT